MKIHFNIGRQSERERFVEGITKWLGYEREVTEDGILVIGMVQIDKENNLTIADEMEDETAERLLQYLYDEGFESNLSYKFDDEPQAEECEDEEPVAQVDEGEKAETDVDAEETGGKTEEIPEVYLMADFNFESVDITKDAEVQRTPYEEKVKEKSVIIQPKEVIPTSQEIGYSLPPIDKNAKYSNTERSRREVRFNHTTREIIEDLKKKYSAGKRVELVKMDDPQAPPVKTHGTVRHVDDIGTIHVEWDNGSSLGVVFGDDDCRLLVTINDSIKQQILKIRDTGLTNMFDSKYVQWLANFCGYFELVCFIEDNVADYVKFITAGRVGDYA